MIVNIGLNRTNDEPLTVDYVDFITMIVLRGVSAYELHQSDTEQTMVFEADVSPEQGERLARLLQQDCIAVYDPATGTGTLYGPRADAWGPFNPEHFILLGGQRAA
jgi:hypothetical protein